MDAKYNIAVFAYNEEKHIESSLTAIYDSVDAGLNKVYLLANGCTDKTIERAASFKAARGLSSLHIVKIDIGDKCNAWNVYVFDEADEVDCHFFVDADCIYSKNCFSLMAQALLDAPDTTHIIAGMPLGGRNVDFYRSLVVERACFFGNLYGMHRRYFDLVRAKQFKLPIGLNWIDSFLTKAANTDIQFLDYNLPNRVTYLDKVGFSFESLSPFKLADLKLYKNRIARYELGKIQELYLDELKVEDWPQSMLGINQDIKQHFNEKTQHLGWVKKYLVKQRLDKLLAKA